MGLSGKINQVRRVIMRGLTKNIGVSTINKKDYSNIPLEVKRVLICRPNSRLGNQLLITPLVQELVETFPECKIDLFVRGFLSPILFENYANVDRIIRLPRKPFKELIEYIKVWFSLRKYRYDIVINVSMHSSSGRLSTQFANSRLKFFNEENEELRVKYADYDHIAKFPIYNLRKYLIQFGIKENNNPIFPLDLKLSSSEIVNGKDVLDNIVSKEKKTISIYTFATGGKCYSESWWQVVYDRIKAKYSEKYNILEVLPIENVSQIGFKAPSFYSKDIREIGSLIANTEVFIGADSGIMHLASSVNTPTVGLFSVSDMDKYQPYNKGSIGVNTNETNVDDLIKVIDKILLAKDERIINYTI